MGKKKRKSRNSQNESASFLSLCYEDPSSSSLNSTNVSITLEDTLPEKLVVTSVESARIATYAKCLKTDFENIIFIHPSIMISYGIEYLVLVQGTQNTTLCVAHSLRHLKKSIVVLPKGNCGFQNEELVTLQAYDGQVKNAEEILISSVTHEDISQNIRAYILRKLSVKYIYIGMPIKYKFFDREYEYVIKNITSPLDLANLSLNETSDSSIPTFYTVSYKTVLKVESENLQQCGDKISFNRIGGLEKQIRSIEKHMQLFLGTGSCLDPICFGTLIIQGPPGTGKSLLLQAIADVYDVYVEYICWYKLFILSESKVKSELETVFQKAINRAPSIIIIDEFNHLCPIRNEAEDYHLYVSKLLQQLLLRIDDSKVMIIAATNDSDCDLSVLQTTRRLMDIIKIKIPSPPERVDILKKLLNTRKHELTYDQIQECAELAHGFTGKDMLDVLKDAEMLSCRRKYSAVFDSREIFNIVGEDNDIGPILYSDLKLTMKMKKTTIVATTNLQVKKVQWSDIGGMSDVKEKLKQLVEWPLKYPEAFKHFNITPSRGVLMYGPPGCSKTMIAKALATECDLNFISKNYATVITLLVFF